MRTPLSILLAITLVIPLSSLTCQGAGKTAAESASEKTTSNKPAAKKAAPGRPAQPAADWEKYVVAAPDVVIPEVIKRHGQQGTGTFVLTIDPKNGEVTEVKVVKSTGYQKLNAIFVMNFFKWRFRPGTVTSAQISRGIGIIGWSRDFHSGRY